MKNNDEKIAIYNAIDPHEEEIEYLVIQEIGRGRYVRASSSSDDPKSLQAAFSDMLVLSKAAAKKQFNFREGTLDSIRR